HRLGAGFRLVAGALDSCPPTFSLAPLGSLRSRGRRYPASRFSSSSGLEVATPRLPVRGLGSVVFGVQTTSCALSGNVPPRFTSAIRRPSPPHGSAARPPSTAEWRAGRARPRPAVV